MDKKSIINNFVWGFLLWLFGFVLSIILFFLVPPLAIGWIMMPIGSIATVWVLMKKVKTVSINQYIFIGFIWMIIAVMFDYFFIVKVLNPEDGYYKPAVYIYYGLTLLLPILVVLYKQRK